MLTLQVYLAASFALTWAEPILGVTALFVVLPALLLRRWFYLQHREPMCGIIRLAVLCRSLLFVVMAVGASAASAFTILMSVVSVAYRWRDRGPLIILPRDETFLIGAHWQRAHADSLLSCGYFVAALVGVVTFLLWLRYMPYYWSDRDLLAWNRNRFRLRGEALPLQANEQAEA